MTKREELLAKIDKAKKNTVLTDKQKEQVIANYEKQLKDLPEPVSTGKKEKTKAEPVKKAAVKKPEPKKPEPKKDQNAHNLVGKKIELYTLGVENPDVYTISSSRLADEKYDKRDLFIEIKDGGKTSNFTIPDKKIKDFLDNKSVTYKEGGKDEYSIILNTSSKKETKSSKDEEYDCDEIIAEAKKRKAKAKARAKVESHKSEGKKGKEKIERVHESIEKKIEKKVYTKPQLESIIKETETLLKALKSALKNL